MGGINIIFPRFLRNYKTINLEKFQILNEAMVFLPLIASKMNALINYCNALFAVTNRKLFFFSNF